jgi:hypothetical protein
VKLDEFVAAMIEYLNLRTGKICEEQILRAWQAK